MRGNTLPRQIVVLVTAGLLAVLAVLWMSLVSVRGRMDDGAAAESVQRVAGRVQTLLESAPA